MLMGGVMVTSLVHGTSNATPSTAMASSVSTTLVIASPTAEKNG